MHESKLPDPPRPRPFWRSCVLVASVISACTSTANAGNRRMTNEELIGMAEEIVLVRMERQRNRSGIYTFIVMEALRSESHPVESTFQLSNKYGGDSYLMNLSPTPDGMIAFFKKDWESEEFPVIRMVADPDRVAAIRKLVAPLSLSTERERLDAVYALYQAEPSNEQLIRAFISELKVMRDPDNFPRALEMIEHADLELQYWAIHTLGRIGDQRAVPLLIGLLDSGEVTLGYMTPHVGRVAAFSLISRFPGAPGVTEAMRDYLSVPEIEYPAARHLIRQESTPELRAIIERYESDQPPETKWIRGRDAALMGGDAEAIRRLCIPLIQLEAITDIDGIKPMYRCAAFLDAFPYLSDPEKLNMQKMLIPVIEPWLFTGYGSSQIRGAKAKFLSTSTLPHAQDLLIQLFVRNEIQTRYDQVVAIMVLRDASPELRAMASTAASRAIDDFIAKANATRSRNLTEAARLLLNFAWLGDEPGLKEALRQLETLNVGQSFVEMRRILTLAIGPREEDLLLARLQRIVKEESFYDWPYKHLSEDRLIYRLGQLKSEKAVPVLLDQLAHGTRYSSFIKDALLNVGNREVIDGLYSLLRAATDESRKYSYAGLLWELESDQMLPTLRELATDDGTDLQLWAWQKLGEVGTLEDIELLRPYSDYWRTDASAMRTSSGPMARIRDRHNYDLNGPIIREQ